MTYGENIVSICQDNSGTDETKENNVNLKFLLEKFNPIFFDNPLIEFFQTLQSWRSTSRLQDNRSF